MYSPNCINVHILQRKVIIEMFIKKEWKKLSQAKKYLRQISANVFS